MTPTITITNDERPGSTRQWLLATYQINQRLTNAEADALIAATVNDLARDSWRFAGSSNGYGIRTRGTYTIEICAQRGRGAPTAWELEMQSTVTGRD